MKTIILFATTLLFMTTVANAQNITFEVSSQNFQGTIFSEITVGDPDINGLQDIYLDGGTDSSGSSPLYSFMYDNNGDSTLTPSNLFPGKETGGGLIIVRDFDNDGDDDYAKWGPTEASGNYIGILMRNNGDGTYTDVTPEDFEPMYFARGVAIDSDNDGNYDIVVQGYNGTQYFAHHLENHGNLDFTLKQSFYGLA